jgi:hypothetical protein
MPFPSVIGCVICEDARQEVGQKYTLLGYFGPLQGMQIAIRTFREPIRLCFVFGCGPGSGHFRLGLRITSPSGQISEGESYEGDIFPTIRGLNIFIRFEGILPGPDRYRVSLLVDGNPVYGGDLIFAQEPAT